MRHSLRIVLGALLWTTGSAQTPTVADVFEVGEQSYWVIKQRDDLLGHCWSRYHGPVLLGEVRAHRFDAQVLLRSPSPGGEVEQRMTTELWTDDRGHLLSAELRAEVADTFSSVHMTVDGGTVAAVIVQGRSTRKLEVAGYEPSFALGNNFVSHAELAMRMQAPGAAPTTYSLFSLNVLKRIPVQVTSRDHDDTNPITSYDDSLGEVLHLDAGHRLQKVELPAQQVVFERLPVETADLELFTLSPPAAPEPPALPREAVTIRDGDVALAGSITRPDGATGRLPAVFFISGSGPQDRDGNSGGLDIGTHAILDRLTTEGFVVLRVDDRGVGESTGPTDGMTFDDLVADARRCVAFLRERDDVDPDRVVLIGHSEGGITAPILAAEGGIAAIVLMAAPARSVTEILTEQLVRARRDDGADDEAIAGYEQQLTAFYTAVRDGTEIDVAVLPDELHRFADERAWVRSHMLQDPLANLRRVDCPILIAQGALDFQVSAERDAAVLNATLDEVGHADHTLLVFDRLDHLFKQVPGERSTAMDYLRNRPVDAEFLDALAAWLAERVAR